MKSYVAGFVRYENKVLLIEKQKPEWQKGKLNGVGGSIEPGETPLEAMIREFEEEVGYHHYQWNQTVTIFNSDWQVIFFTAVLDQLLKVPGPLQISKEEKLGWYPIYPLPGNVISNLEWLIPMCFYNQLKFPIEVPYKEKT